MVGEVPRPTVLQTYSQVPEMNVKMLEHLQSNEVRVLLQPECVIFFRRAVTRPLSEVCIPTATLMATQMINLLTVEDYPKASNVDNEVEIDVDNDVEFAEMDVNDEVGFGHDAEANVGPGHEVHVHMFEETEMKGVSHPAEYDMDMIYDQEEDIYN